jgi:type I restriction enzyme S subunit
MDRVEKYLTERHADSPKLRDCLIDLYCQYATWGLKDAKFDQDFTDGRDEHFYPYLWEMLLACHFKGIGLDISSADEGPDFKIDHQGQTIWVEAICPSPSGLPAEWLGPCPPGEVRVRDFPHVQMLLRWTAALKEKREKLTGRIERDHKTGERILKPGYLTRGVVGEGEPYVVAVSACRLGADSASLHCGISQFPFAVEAAFPVGPIEVVIDRKTMKKVDQRHAYRHRIKKPNGADVPTDSFLNPDYAGVSALLGTPAGLNAACGYKSPIALVHNPLATNVLPTGILGVDDEYVAEDRDDHYELHKVNGVAR